MAIPAVPAHPAPAAGAPAASTTPPAPAGVGSTGSSIASAAPAAQASTGCCATISAWIASICDSIRGCLANLPLIGYWFATETTTTQPITPPAIAPYRVSDADAQSITRIKGVFIQPSEVAPGTVVLPPAADVVTHALGQFRAILGSAAKMHAFTAILSAANSVDPTDGSDPIKRQFYNELSPALQNAFKHEMYTQNGNSSTINGVDHRDGFGDYMVWHQLRNNLALTAARNLQLRYEAQEAAAAAAAAAAPRPTP